MQLNQSFWNERYDTHQTGWDIGYPSTPLKTYIDQLTDRSLRILMPGAGNAYEVEYLYKLGFENISVIDISDRPLKNFLQRVPDFPVERLIHEDFFEHQGTYDLIFEQTFFCALDPMLRPRYVEKMASLLSDGGKLVGVLFDAPMYTDHPPYGGSIAAYQALFSSRLTIHTMEAAYNSIVPRAGSEAFMICTKNSER